MNLFYITVDTSPSVESVQKLVTRFLKLVFLFSFEGLFVSLKCPTKSTTTAQQPCKQARVYFSIALLYFLYFENSDAKKMSRNGYKTSKNAHYINYCYQLQLIKVTIHRKILQVIRALPQTSQKLFQI